MTTNKERALQAVLTCRTKKEAAKAAGITERTLQNYFKQEDFQEAYKKALADMVQEAVDKAKASLAPALSVLRDIVNDTGESTQNRIAACRGALEYGMRLIETADIVQRLDALEKEAGL